MASLWFRLVAVWSRGLPGSVAVVAMGVTLVIGFALLVGVVRQRSNRSLVLSLLVAEGALVGAAGVVIELAQRDLFLLLVPRAVALDPPQRARLVARALSDLLDTQYLAARVLVLGLLLAAVAVWRERPWAWWHRSLGLGLLLAAITLGTILIRERGWHFGTGSCPDSGVDFGCRTRVLWEALLDGGRVFRVGQGALWLTGIVSAVAFVGLSVRDTRRGWVASRPAVLASSSLMALGVLATVGTRAKAWDGAHSLPPLGDGDARCSLVRTDVDTLPRGPADCTTTHGPLLELAGSEVEIDGDRVFHPAELEPTLAAKRELWHVLNPGHPPPGTLRVAAGRTTKIRDIEPVVGAARRAGFERIAVVYRAEPPTVAHTATAGALARVRCCDAIAGASSFSGDSWADVAAAATPVKP